MTPETEQKLLSDIASIKRDVADSLDKHKRLDNALIGTPEKPGALYVHASLVKDFYNPDEPEKGIKMRVEILEADKRTQVAVDRWFWPKVIGIASAFPGAVELYRLFTNKPPSH